MTNSQNFNNEQINNFNEDFTILYVEDDFISISLVKRIFNGKFKIDFASNFRTALEKVELTNYNLVLMDINLGKEMNGIQLTQKIRQIPHYKNVPFIAVTGYRFLNAHEYLLSEGMSDYLPKPFSPNELINIVNKHKSKCDQLK